MERMVTYRISPGPLAVSVKRFSFLVVSKAVETVSGYLRFSFLSPFRGRENRETPPIVGREIKMKKGPRGEETRDAVIAKTRASLDAAWAVFRFALEPARATQLDELRAGEDALERDRCRECRCVRSDPSDVPYFAPCGKCGKKDEFGAPVRALRER